MINPHKMTDRELLEEYRRVAEERYNLWRSAFDPGSPGSSTSWAVHLANYDQRLDYLREQLDQRGILEDYND